MPGHNGRFLTRAGQALLYLQIALAVAARYALRPSLFNWSPVSYFRFLLRALRLLLVFRDNKPVRTSSGWKIDLYLPAYPSPAFFYALEAKLFSASPMPLTVVFSMTKACQYKCAHCYQHRDGGDDLPEDLLLTAAKQMQDLGVAMFDIEGGEPLLRLPRLLKLLHALDNRAELWVNTTGAGLTQEALASLKAARLFGVMISVHSPDPAVHDGLTGVPGSFDTACASARAFRAAGIIVAVNSVLSEPEIRAGGLERLMELSRSLDSDFVQLIHPKPAGNWLGHRENMQKDASVIELVRTLHRRYNRSGGGYPCLVSQVLEEAEYRLGCTAGGVDRFYLNAYGEIQPCEFLNLSFGNLREEPLLIIMQRMRSYFPEPCSDWLCCTQGPEIARLFSGHKLDRTPLPWSVTKTLVEKWSRGTPTPLYRKLGLYRK